MTETKMQLEDWLDDLCVRFIINLPHEELESVERICFQVEEAQWFYEDFIRPLDPALPSLSLKAFALRIFQHCPLMSQWSHYHHITAFSEFLAYKTRVPVRGAIMLNQDMDEVVLVKGWKKGANWSFPRGKINKGEKDLDCAIREVYEETGFGIREANLVQDDDSVKHIEITMREQHMRLYVFRGVPRDAHFEPRTRKEISKIEWYKLSELPTLRKNKQDEGTAVTNANKFYMVAPFLHPLKKWIAQQKKLDAKAQAGNPHSHNEGYTLDDTSYGSNGVAAQQQNPGAAVPSDLPEVTSTQDASSHLKQLLKIGGGHSAPVQVPSPQFDQPVESARVDQSKSNALLTLLRQGSSVPAPRVHKLSGPSPHAQSPGVPQASTQATHLAPNFFPGFPQQHHQTAPLIPSPQTLTPQSYNAVPHHSMQSSAHVTAHPQYPPIAQNELSASPSLQRAPQSHAQNFSNTYSPAPPSAPAPAPFQRTGDPQFSQHAHPSQASGAAIPPANKLPPPKLTNHSRALLGFFKGDASKTPNSPHAATLAIPASGASQTIKTSPHQNGLLDLFKGGQQKAPTPSPVELSGHPVPSSIPSKPNTEIQILQRNNSQQVSDKNSGPQANKAGQMAATVSGPVSAPQFEASSKAAPKKTNGSSRKNNQSRQQASAQPLSSPITILSRPQTAKRDASATRHNLQTVQPAQNSPIQPRAPEPVKPFQPQILRRSEKTGYENLLTNAMGPGSAGRKPSLPDSSPQRPELAPQSSFNRRPSQTSAQKEALLSLFGKAPASPSPISAAQEYQATMANQPSFAASGLVSPLSSLHLPTNGDSPSRRGTPSENDMTPNRIASPSNKAFLLGYLQDVAKGNK
ncbi:hypothetical protein N7470_008705 [Penicillium chermesinum]|nr:hypothetical protein N7470_008705 [Penicillium chermesinum]